MKIIVYPHLSCKSCQIVFIIGCALQAWAVSMKKE